MLALLNRIAKALLATSSGTNGEAARFEIAWRVGNPLAATSHAIWSVIFFLNGLTFMGWYNVLVALLFFASTFYKGRTGFHLWILILLWWVEVPLHALLGTLHTGLTTLFWLFPVASAMISLVVHEWSWPRRSAIAAAMLGITLAICLTAFFVEPLSQITLASRITLFAQNFLSALGGVTLYLGMNQFLVVVTEKRLQREYDRAEGLLKNILPDPIALRLKEGEHLIADEHTEVSVLFADIVNFTEASAKLTPAELVETLNLVFTEFDRLATEHGAEKIKTIGDAYMVVVGVPDARESHAAVAVEIALAMLDVARDVSARTHFPIDLRIGINSGPVVAGVIGTRKFAYDLWGDAVNVASRMETHALPGEVMITEDTRALLPERFRTKPEGVREVKGKGPMQVFSVALCAPPSG